MSAETDKKENDPNVCIWKPPVKSKKERKVSVHNFPCRFPDKEKNSELCNPCLLGDVFAMNYTQMMNVKQQAGLNEEIMTYLRTFTSDGTLDDLR